MKLRLKDTKGEFTITVPLSVHEISFKGYSEYKALMGELSKNIKEDENPEEETNQVPTLLILLEALQTICSNNIKRLPFSIGDEDTDSLIYSGFTYNIDTIFETEFSIIRLQAHVLNLITQYKPQNFVGPAYSIKIKGDKYYIEPRKASRLLSSKAYTIGETIELMEFNRRFKEKIKQKGDPEGNLGFNLGLTEMAILLRKKNEDLPSNKTKFNQFVNKRKRLFARVSLNHILDIRFFLLNTLRKYAITEIIGYSLKVKNQS